MGLEGTWLRLLGEMDREGVAVPVEPGGYTRMFTPA